MKFLAMLVNGRFRLFGPICDLPENRQVQMVGIFRKTYFDNLSVTGEHNGVVD